jgi:hypothetical protein
MRAAMLFFALLLGANAASFQSEAGENPIRRIVNLLQKMAKEIDEEGDKDEEMSEKYVCYCEKNDGELSASTADLREKIPQIESSIKEAVSQKVQLAADLATHKQDRSDAQAAIASATAQREKEASAFDAESTESKANIAACKKAITAIMDGMAGSFLQSAAADTIRKVVMNRDLERYQREMLTEFLQGTQGYAPGSGEIVGILKQLLENMEKELSDATDTENAAIAEFEALTAAKEKEIQAATEAIEAKTQRAGEVAVQIVNLKNDLEDTKDQLGEDEAFLMELKKTCKTKAKEYEERKVSRAQELVAVQETIKILNDDDALDLFKKTLSFMQTTTRTDEVRDQALSALKNVKDSQTGLIQLALMGKKVGFEKIIKMIDEMVVTLKEEQKDDEAQLKWCNAEFDTTEDKTADEKRRSEGAAAKIAETEDAIATLKDELAALAKGIKDLDQAVADATEQRKAEHVEFVEVAAQNNAALQLLGVAENRLNKFYNPAAYMPPQRRELTEEERIYVQSGGADPRDAEEAAAKEGTIAGTGIAVLQAAPAPPPETMEYKKKDAGGPTALLKKLSHDLEMDMQAAEIDEKQAQKDYEEMMQESAAKRAADSKAISEKDEQKAGAEGMLQDAKKEKKSADAEILALGEYMATLHGSCDFLVKNFDLRREARSSEIDAITKAKAVLSGADYSFVQTGGFLERRHRHRHRDTAHFVKHHANRITLAPMIH